MAQQPVLASAAPPAPRKASLTRNVFANWTSLVVNLVISFLLSPFVVKSLGSSAYGIWALSLQFTGYLYLFDFGVRESVIRYTAKYVARGQTNQLSRVLATAMMIYAPITLLTVILTAVLAWVVPKVFDVSPEYVSVTRWTVIFVGLTVAQNFVFNVFNGVLQGLRRIDIANMCGIVTALLRAGATVLFLKMNYGLIALGAIQFAAACLWGVAVAWAATRLMRAAGTPLTFHLPPPRRRKAMLRRVFGFGYYVLLNNISQKITFASDAIVVAWFLPLTAVTYYSIAGSLIDQVRSLVRSTAQVFSPAASHLHALRQHEQLRSVVLSASKLLILVTLPIALSFVFLGGDFIRLWMGEEFAEPAGDVLAVLGVAQIFAAPVFVLSAVLYALSQPKIIATLRVIEAIANIGLSVLLIQLIGLTGVAYGTAIPSVIMGLVVVPAIACPHLGMQPGRYLATIFGSALPAAAVLGTAAWLVHRYAPPPNLWMFFIDVAGIVALYGGVAYWTALSAQERELIRARVGGRRR